MPDTTDEPVPTVVYIVGSGRSGSTLLERMLGGIEKTVNIGELIDLFRRVYAGNERCGCGHLFSECPFWTEVGLRAFGGWHEPNMRRVAALHHNVARQRFIPQHMVTRNNSSFFLQRREYQETYRRLYQAIASVANATVVVDASKQPAQLFALADSDMDIRVIHLKRDARGVAWSLSKRHVTRPQATAGAETMFRQTPLLAGCRWAVCQAEADLLSLQVDDFSSMRYEDLVSDPAGEVGRVLGELGLNTGGHDLNHLGAGVVHLPSSHGLSGNPSRFEQGDVELRLDESWRSQMPRGQQFAVAGIGAPDRVIGSISGVMSAARHRKSRRGATWVDNGRVANSSPAAQVRTAPELPNFLYIGPDKAGSTWLHEVLMRHPQIYLSPAKDLYFFDRYFDKGTKWYRNFFKEATIELIVGEICQDYLFDAGAAERISGVLGDPKLMVTLRNPVDRAFSSYLYMRKHGRGPATFAEALDSHPKLIEHGRYGKMLDSFSEEFASENIHVAVFDDLKSDPQAFLDDVLGWLSVEDMKLDEGELDKKLPASRARFLPAAWGARQAANLVRALNGAELVGKVKRSPVAQKILYVPLGQKAVAVPAEDVARIHRELRDDVERLDSTYGLGLIERWGWT